MSPLKMAVVAVAVVAGLGSASAATVQNSRGTFIQDRQGVWHQYVRVPQIRSSADFYARDDYVVRRQYLPMSPSGHMASPYAREGATYGAPALEVIGRDADDPSQH
jgi:hypothetical protein